MGQSELYNNRLGQWIIVFSDEKASLYRQRGPHLYSEKTQIPWNVDHPSETLEKLVDKISYLNEVSIVFSDDLSSFASLTRTEQTDSVYVEGDFLIAISTNSLQTKAWKFSISTHTLEMAREVLSNTARPFDSRIVMRCPSEDFPFLVYIDNILTSKGWASNLKVEEINAKNGTVLIKRDVNVSKELIPLLDNQRSARSPVDKTESDNAYKSSEHPWIIRMRRARLGDVDIHNKKIDNIHVASKANDKALLINNNLLSEKENLVDAATIESGVINYNTDTGEADISSPTAEILNSNTVLSGNIYCKSDALNNSMQSIVAPHNNSDVTVKKASLGGKSFIKPSNAFLFFQFEESLQASMASAIASDFFSPGKNPLELGAFRKKYPSEFYIYSRGSTVCETNELPLVQESIPYIRALIRERIAGDDDISMFVGKEMLEKSSISIIFTVLKSLYSNIYPIVFLSRKPNDLDSTWMRYLYNYGRAPFVINLNNTINVEESLNNVNTSMLARLPDVEYHIFNKLLNDLNKNNSDLSDESKSILLSNFHNSTWAKTLKDYFIEIKRNI